MTDYQDAHALPEEAQQRIAHEQGMREVVRMFDSGERCVGCRKPAVQYGGDLEPYCRACDDEMGNQVRRNG